MIQNLDEIKSQIPIEQVLRLIGYSKSNPLVTGNEIRDFCPIHNGDHQRSLTFNTATKLGKCHNGECDFEGDIINLYCQATNKDFNTAIRDLANDLGIEIKFKGATKTDFSKRERTPSQVIEDSSPHGNHKYLSEKCVVACPGLYFGGDEMGNDSIIVPLYNIDNKLKTIQCVNGNGKYFLKGYSPKGAFFTIGSFKDGDVVHLAEGLATALTIWMALDKNAPVISYGSANNLNPVIDALKNHYPNITPIICLDNNDAAFNKAKKVNPAHNCSYRLPSFEGFLSHNSEKALADFNDIVSKCGQPFSAVRDQLMKEVFIEELPISKKDFMAEESTKKNDSPAGSFNDEYQEDILNYLLKHPFEQVIMDGFSPEKFQSNMFSGSYHAIMNGIIKSWEKDLPISITQISIDSGNHTPELYALLTRIEKRPLINANQIEERLKRISHHKSKQEFNELLAKVQRSDNPFHEKTDILRRGINDLQGNYETILPQSHYLHQIINDLQSPKHKPLATGIVSLDRLIGGGFIKGELCLLSGGAGAGKTAFALQIADTVAERNSVVVYISVEIGRTKLTERSLKRLSYQKNAGEAFGDRNHATAQYQKFAPNIYIKKGHHGMQVSEIRGIILSIMRQHRDKDVLLIIDPFQRLGTGNEKIDSTNETIKVNNLVSQIKEMAEDLNIPILALSDTVKSHKDNKSGEGAVRGSYMADHTADNVIMLRASRSALKAVYDIDSNDNKLNEYKKEDPFVEKIDAELKKRPYTEKDGRYYLKEDYDKYVSLVTSKVRDSGKFSPLFIYRPQYHLFEDTQLWENILPKPKE